MSQVCERLLQKINKLNLYFSLFIIMMLQILRNILNKRKQCKESRTKLFTNC